MEIIKNETPTARCIQYIPIQISEYKVNHIDDDAVEMNEWKKSEEKSKIILLIYQKHSLQTNRKENQENIKQSRK